MSNPQYTTGAVYKELQSIIQAAGIEIEYTEIEEGILGKAKEHGKISMPNDNRFDTDEYAVFVLGHELGHQLIFDLYNDNEHNNSGNNIGLYNIIEAHCEVIGAAMLTLAEKIAMKKAESIFLRENRHDRD